MAVTPMAGVTIGRLADEVGVSVDTVRYYERRGLLPAPSRTRAGYRTYGDDDRWRLAFILRAKDLGFTLKEIDGLFAHAGDAAAVRSAAASKLDAVAEQRVALDAVEARLKVLVQLCDDGDDGCATLETPCLG
jgi:MerR family copper efflux transcriptional regulator